ncbi:MAG TPA: XRE family transcriptional regulator [Devosiaceae bacterium]
MGAAAVLMASTNQQPGPVRGLNRAQAAHYVGVSPSKFDEMVADGLMPRPRVVGARKIWDLRELDLSFDDLPREDEPVKANPWDEVTT